MSLVLALGCSGHKDSPPSMPAPAYRYKFEPKSLAKADTAERIPALEAKVGVAQPQPIDLTELADLYAQRAQASGNPEDYDKALATAQKSLALLPSPNGAR